MIHALLPTFENLTAAVIADAVWLPLVGFPVLFGVAMPLLGAVVGTAVGTLLIVKPSATLVATLVASACYIAVPMAARLAARGQPDPVADRLKGLTCPFKLRIGIPQCRQVSAAMHLGLG